MTKTFERSLALTRPIFFPHARPNEVVTLPKDELLEAQTKYLNSQDWKGLMGQELESAKGVDLVCTNKENTPPSKPDNLPPKAVEPEVFCR